MLMSSATTSGLQAPGERYRLLPVGRAADDLDSLLAREHGFERLGEEAVVVCDQDSDGRRHSGHNEMVPR